MSITFNLCQQILQNSPQWTFKTTLQAFCCQLETLKSVLTLVTIDEICLFMIKASYWSQMRNLLLFTSALNLTLTFREANLPQSSPVNWCNLTAIVFCKFAVLLCHLLCFSAAPSRSGFVIPESNRSFMCAGLAVILVFEGAVSCM